MLEGYEKDIYELLYHSKRYSLAPPTMMANWRSGKEIIDHCNSNKEKHRRLVVKDSGEVCYVVSSLYGWHTCVTASGKIVQGFGDDFREELS